MLYRTLVKHCFFPLSLARNGELAQLRYRREFERTQWLGEEELRALQWRRLHALLLHAYRKCPFYAARFRQVGVHPEEMRDLNDLRVLPPLEKADIQRYGPDMIASDWPEADRIVNQTGGSTGTPIRFHLSRDRKCSRAAATWRHNAWAGWDVGDRTAVLWGAPVDKPADTWRARLRRWFLAEPLWLDTGCLTEQSLRAFAVTLQRHRPTAILAYARAAVLFAKFLRDQGLSIPAPRGLVTSAEVLEDDDRRLLEEVFGAPVFNRYGCREVSVIASECPAHAGLHVMGEGLYLEIETPRGPARPGEVGSILVTDLLNHAMPLIRYRIGDLGSWAAGKCACGRGLPRLEKVSGRVTDFLVGTGDQLVSGVFLATYVVAQRPSLGQVQIRQDEPGVIVYRIVPGPAFDPVADEEYLRQTTRRYLGAGVRVGVERVESLPTEPSGKFLFSRSSVVPGFLKLAAEKEVAA
jgi:phenylacetate-CoA ligase